MAQDHPIVVVAAGPGPSSLSVLPADAVVIAADGGLDRCAGLGLVADVVVGDLDSVSPARLAAAEARGTTILRHPVRKDATDLELALDAALAREAAQVLVVASAEGRLDHLLASLLLLGHARYAGLRLDAAIGDALVHVVRDERAIVGEPGALVTLLALHGRVEGVRTTGLEYPLDGEPLEAGSSRGVSNVLADRVATVSVERGVLLIVRPEGAR